MHRIVHRQFPWQTGVGVNPLMRAFRIFGRGAVEAIVIREGSGRGASTESEESIEGGVPRSASIEAEDELVQVALQMGLVHPALVST